MPSAIGPVSAARRGLPEASGDLRIGGTKTFAVQVGSNRDLSLEQSLRVSIAGTVAENVRVTAELSDQNLPIQPEGTTEDIREIDKVLVEIESPHYKAVLGSYDMAWTRGEFGRYSRRLDGAQLESRYDRWDVMGGVASARGKFRSYQLPVIDGIQGPYRLTDEAGNPNVLVVAGTERVYIDGVALRRGEDNDYTIDYAAGEITFTERRLITNDMRIVVDYEFTAEEYSRTSAIAGGTVSSGHVGSLRGRGWETSVFFAQEGDDPNDALALVIDDAAHALLEKAGDDPLAAARQGWTSATNGAYTAIDLANAQFAYVGTGGEYNVSFTRVGPGKGTYTRDPALFRPEYTYVGPGRGEYAPYVLYPLPERQRVVSSVTTARPTDRLAVEGEIAASEVDRNILSTIDDGDNTSLAGRLSLAIDETPIVPFDRDLGTIALTLTGRAVETGFPPNPPAVSDHRTGRQPPVGTSRRRRSRAGAHLLDEARMGATRGTSALARRRVVRSRHGGDGAGMAGMAHRGIMDDHRDRMAEDRRLRRIHQDDGARSAGCHAGYLRPDRPGQGADRVRVREDRPRRRGGERTRRAPEFGADHRGQPLRRGDGEHRHDRHDGVRGIGEHHASHRTESRYDPRRLDRSGTLAHADVANRHPQLAWPFGPRRIHVAAADRSRGRLGERLRRGGRRPDLRSARRASAERHPIPRVGDADGGTGTDLHPRAGRSRRIRVHQSR